MKSYLNKAGLFLIALMAGAAAFGQQLTIDQISSDSMALRYVKQMNFDAKTAPQWKFFYLTTGQEWQSYFNFSDREITQYGEKTSAQKWLKTDLNADGKTDLIVSGYIAKKPGDWSTATFKVLVYLSQSGKSYTALNLLPDGSDGYPAYINEVQIGAKKYLQLTKWQVEDEDARADQQDNLPFQSDTLSFSPYWDCFLNFQQKGMRSADISQISYKVMEDFQGSYHGLNIDLQTTKKTNMDIIIKRATEKEPEINKARLAKDLWVQMDTLIRKTYVTGIIKGDTTVIHHDLNAGQLPIFLTVTYKDGHKETIQDYGMGATYSAVAIYSCLENIIQNVFDQLQRRQMMLNSLIDGALEF